jgi:hypothetical protein
MREEWEVDAIFAKEKAASYRSLIKSIYTCLSAGFVKLVGVSHIKINYPTGLVGCCEKIFCNPTSSVG